MDRTIAKNWIAALDGGKYKQAYGTMVGPGGENYCCLGVLAREMGYDFDSKSAMPVNLPQFNVGLKKWEASAMDTWPLSGNGGDPEVFLTDLEKEKLGKDSLLYGPVFKTTLSLLNDSGQFSFKAIAKIIARQVDEL